MIRTRAPRLAGPAVALLLGSALLAGCSGDEPALTGATGEPRPSTDSSAGGDAGSSAGSSGGAEAPSEETSGPAPTRSAKAAAEPEPGAGDDVPPFPADTADDTAEPSGGPLSVVAVRAARQDGFDRVVLELDGEQAGEPGWTVGYTDDPRQDGSGDAVEVAGDAVLQVVVTGVGYPFDTGVEQEASTDLAPGDTEVVREVDLQATFEGQFQAFVGLDAQAPFRVFRLADPARVVIDVQHR